MSRAKYNNVALKEGRQKNKLNKHYSKVTSKTLIQSQKTLNNVRPRHMFKVLKHLIYTKIKNRMIKTRLMKDTSIENKEIIMAMTMTKKQQQ